MKNLLPCLLFASSLFGAGCSSPTAVGYGPGIRPAERDRLHRSTPIPKIAKMEQLTATTVAETFDVPLSFAQNWFLKMPLSEALLGTEQIPGVRGTTSLTQGEWGQVGARRRVDIKDNSSALEQILVCELPERFRYVVWNYTSDAAKYVRYGVGEFRFEAIDQNRTRVHWTYAFEARGWPASWFLGSFVRGDYREFMVSSLATMKRLAERALKS